MRHQRTLKKELVFEGIGLHTGSQACLKLKPAPKDSGIVFYRKDKNVSLNATAGMVSETSFATSLGNNGTQIKTVEHLLAAIAGLGIDNLNIEIEGPEVPIYDGSSKTFAERIASAGVENQPSGRPYLRIVKHFSYVEGNAEFSALPYEGRRITYHIFYPHKLLGAQHMTYELEEESFLKEIAPARTFGFLKDVQYLRERGLAKGGSLENAIVLSESGIINSSPLRYKDEFLRHKILDLIGDLSLLGFPVHGHIIAKRTGHASNLNFVRALLAASDCWQIVSEGKKVEHRTAAKSGSHVAVKGLKFA
jgi:UDP-3-O-[3-hydroxymyristoyl] N-acetylglucosamine deacetylase